MKSPTFTFLAASIAVALCIGGCKSAPEPDKGKSPDSQVRKASPLESGATAQDPKELEFKMAARAFVAEAQSMGRLLKLTPIDESVFKVKYTTTLDLLTRIPPPPPARRDLEAIKDDIAKIHKELVSAKEGLDAFGELAEDSRHKYAEGVAAACHISGFKIELEANELQRRLEQPLKSK